MYTGSTFSVPAFDPISSRPGSRAASPHAQAPPPTSLSSHYAVPAPHQGPPPPRSTYSAPGMANAATFGPGYYTRTAPTDLGQGAPAHTAAPAARQTAPAPQPTYQAPAPYQAPASTYGARPAHQPPRNSMEMVNDALTQWRTKLEAEQAQMAQLEEEERRMEAEEAALRRRQSELMAQNRNVDQIMLSTQRGWSTLYQQEHELRLQEQDPSSTEERALLEKLAAMEHRVALARSQHADAQHRHAHVEKDLTALQHVEVRQKAQDSMLSEIVNAFDKLETRRMAAKATCEAFADLEAQRERAAQEHITAINREAVENGDVSAAASRSSSAPEPQATMQQPRLEPILTAPVVPTDEAQAAAEMDMLLNAAEMTAMDSVVISVSNNTKKRRTESASMPLSAF